MPVTSATEILDYAASQAIKHNDNRMLDMITQAAGVVGADDLLKMIHNAARSADLWISEWEKYKDVSSVRNASMAIGKMMGVYNVYSSAWGHENDLPEEVIVLVTKYNDIWCNLSISKEMAGLIAKHG